MNTTINPMYTKNKHKWRLVRDCVNDDVKRHAADPSVKADYDLSEGGYLIKPEAMSDKGFAAYCAAAEFTNFTGQTLDVLKGGAFSRPFKFTGPEGADLPESIAYLSEDTDARYTKLDDLLKLVATDVFSVGRIGLIVEYPQASEDEARTMADIGVSGKRAKILTYSAESIVDWNEYGTYVKICEPYSMVAEGKTRTNHTREIELYIDEDGFYVQKVDDDDGSPVRIYEPRNGAGARLDYIPFWFVGADSNQPIPSRPPLYKQATLNLQHFRKDAQEAINQHQYSHGTLFVSTGDMDSQTFGMINGLTDESGNFVKPLAVGGTAYIVGQGGSATLLQAETGDSISKTKMEIAENMVRIGAQLITTGQNETAEAARIRKATGTASLGDMVGNIEDAMQSVIETVSAMNNSTGQADEFKFEMNKKFFDDRLSPQTLQQLSNMASLGQIPKEQLFDAMKRDGSLGISDDDDYQDWSDLIVESDTGGIDVDSMV